MRLITNSNDVENMFATKKTIEQYLVLEILDQFNSGTLINELRMMARMALEEILNAPKDTQLSAYTEEKGLRVWKRGSPEKVYEQVNRLTASEISDIIRFFGTVIEKGKPHFIRGELQWMSAVGTKYVGEEAKKAGYRVGTKEGLFDKEKFRLRGGKNPTPTWMENLVGSSPTNRGIAIKAALDDGVLGKIENTFGLWKGAAISGTTADTIYFIDRFGQGLDPLLNLLPVATLTYNYHHALVEIAMVLTTNRRMTYSIGSYTTLLPHNAHHPATGSIKKTLKKFEDRIDNKRILVFYNKKSFAKECIIFDEKNEKEDFKRLARTDITMWQTFSTFKAKPTQEDLLKDLLKKYNPTLANKVEMQFVRSKMPRYRG